MKQKTIHQVTRAGGSAVRSLLVMLLMVLTATQGAWAQDLSTLSVYTEVPTVTDGQTSNWSVDNENYDKLVDGNLGTKYGLGTNEPWVEFHYAQPFIPKGYALWTANDESYAHNPKNWTIMAKVNASDAWTTLVSVDNSSNDKLPLANNTETRFALDNNTAYQYFRFEATRNADWKQFQLAELQFLCIADPTDLQYADVTGISPHYLYTGSEIPITFSVSDADGTPLTLGTDYTATLGETTLNSNNFSVTDEGSYTLTITAKDDSDYSGTTSRTFSVVGRQAINLPTVEHGTVTATVNGEAATHALPGDQVTISMEWEEGYECRFNSLKDANENDVEYEYQWTDNSFIITFTMPETAVTFDATITEQKYWVNTPGYGDKFSITANPSPATKDQTVTLTINKAEGVTMSNLKASYRDYSGGTNKARRRSSGEGTDEDAPYIRYLELTKVDDTHYTFTMPAAYVDVTCDTNYSGQYAINLAEGLPAEAVRITVDRIDVTSANEDDIVLVEFDGAQVDNLSVTGPSGPVPVEYDYFTMPAEAVTISASLKYQLYYSSQWYYTLTASAGDTEIPAGSYIAPGTTVTLTANSEDENLILSYLNVWNRSAGEDVTLTDMEETSEEGYPHVYTTTFVMPYASVSVDCAFVNPITVSFNANGGTGTMDAITIGQGGIIYLPECGFTREGYTFAGWTIPDWKDELLPAGETVQLPWSDVTITAQWTENVLTLTGGTLTLKFSEALTSIVAGKPYIVKWDKPDGYDNDPSLYDITNPEFSGVTIKSTTPTPDEFSKDGEPDVCQFVGQYSPFSVGDGETESYTSPDGNLDEIVMLGSGNQLGYSTVNRQLCAFRAHFFIPRDVAQTSNARAMSRYVIDFGDGETTGIVELSATTHQPSTPDGIYTLQGIRISPDAMQPGRVYIVNGKKVIKK